MTVRWIGPMWLQTTARRLGIKVFDRAVAAELVHPAVTDSDLRDLRNLRYLEQVTIGPKVSVTDDGVQSLRRSMPGVRVVQQENSF